MNRTKAVVYIDDKEIHPREELPDSLEAFVGILTGVLAGSAAWLAIIAAVLNLP